MSDSGDLSQFSSMLQSLAGRFHIDIDPNQVHTNQPVAIDNDSDELDDGVDLF